MKKINNPKIKRIWLSVFVLLICIVSSIVVLASKMESYLFDDSGAIPLISETSASLSGKTSSNSTAQGANDTQPKKKSSFEAGDDNVMWTTDTRVEVFRVSYVNGEQLITVNSDNGDKLIAPGTENSYTFKLKNTGDAALDYTVCVDAYFTPGNITIPITGRISRYDGEWIVGDKNTYADVKELDRAEDKATLGAGEYSYYTLDWIWPYESGNDRLDTLLGNMAVNQDLIFTVVITTKATENVDPNAVGGLDTPQTGDNSNTALWFVLLAVAFIVSILLIFLPRRRNNTL